MLKELTQKYIEAFNSKNLELLSELFTENFVLEDPIVKRIEGKDNVLIMIKGIFESSDKLNFYAKNIFQDKETTIIEFVLELNDTILTGTDIIEWENSNMKELRAYLDIPKG